METTSSDKLLDEILAEIRADVGCERAHLTAASRSAPDALFGWTRQDAADPIRWNDIAGAGRRRAGNPGPVWSAGMGAPCTLEVPCPAGAPDDPTLVLTFASEMDEPAREQVEALAARTVAAIGRHLRLSRRLREEEQRNRNLMQALNLSDLGVAVADAQGQLLFVNQAVKDLLKGDHGLRCVSNMLAADSLRDSLKLRTTLDHCIRSAANPGEAAPAQILMINRARGRRPLLLSITGLPQHGTTEQEAAAVIFVLKPDHEVDPLLTALCRLYGLSPVESRLTCLLVAGKTVAEAAIIMHIKELTARAYLKQIFSKTNLNRQTDLVRLLMSQIIPINGKIGQEPIA